MPPMSVSPWFSWRRRVLTLGATWMFAAWPATAQGPGSVMPCPTTGNGFAMRCVCWTAGNAAVWGTGVYAMESGICSAARHAGVIGESGGGVVVIPLPGQAQYVGSYRNGVASRDKGASQRSFRVGQSTAPWGVAPAR